jgi:hypothetical protein
MRRKPSTARKTLTPEQKTQRDALKALEDTPLYTKREDGIYVANGSYYKVEDGQVLCIDGSNVCGTLERSSILKRLRKAFNQDELMEFVFEYNCQAEFIRIEYNDDDSESTDCYAELQGVNKDYVFLNLYDKRVVHNHCTTYKQSSWDDQVAWKNIYKISNIREIPSWTPEDTPNCSTCSRSANEDSEIDEEYEDSIGDGEIY